MFLLVLLIFKTLFLSASDVDKVAGVPCTEHHVTIPRQCQTGTLLLSLEYVGQTFQISTSDPSFHHFAVLANGDVIRAAASGPAPVGTVSLSVECRLGLLAWTELIHIMVVDEKDGGVLVSFAQPYFEGHVVENAPPTSTVKNLHNISVIVSNFQGHVLADVNHAGTEFTKEEFQSKLRVQFSISAGPDYMFYLVDNGDGSVALRTLVELDYERQSQYLLTAVAKVSGGGLTTASASARVRVYVDNINDNAPTMHRTEYYFRFHDVTGPEEGAGMHVEAYDADNDSLTYNIDGDEKELFFIDAVTGGIYFRSPWTERRARRSSYDFQVYADDGLHRSDPATVRVHRLDQSPLNDDVVLEQFRSNVDTVWWRSADSSADSRPSMIFHPHEAGRKLNTSLYISAS